MLLIVGGIIKLVPHIWKDVLAGNPVYVAIAVPFEILSIAGDVLLFWAVSVSCLQRLRTATTTETGDPARLWVCRSRSTAGTECPAVCPCDAQGVIH